MKKTWKGRKSFNLSLVWVCLSLSRPDPLFLATFECDSRKLGYNPVIVDARRVPDQQLNRRTLNCTRLIDLGLMIGFACPSDATLWRFPPIKSNSRLSSSNFQLQPLFTLIPSAVVVMTHFHLNSSFRAVREWRQHSEKHGISWIADDDAKNVS